MYIQLASIPAQTFSDQKYAIMDHMKCTELMRLTNNTRNVQERSRSAGESRSHVWAGKRRDCSRLCLHFARVLRQPSESQRCSQQLSTSSRNLLEFNYRAIYSSEVCFDRVILQRALLVITQHAHTK